MLNSGAALLQVRSCSETMCTCTAEVHPMRRLGNVLFEQERGSVSIVAATVLPASHLACRSLSFGAGRVACWASGWHTDGVAPNASLVAQGVALWRGCMAHVKIKGI